MEREKRYIAEFMAETFLPDQYALNVPLGSIPEELVKLYGLNGAAAVFRPSRRRIDAVAWTMHTYILIEAKIRDPLEGLGRLNIYYTLAQRTLDLPEYRGQEFEKWLVVPYSLDWIIQVAHDDNIKLHVYWRDWIADYVKQRQEYFTQEYRQARDEKQRLRKALGLE